MEIKFKLSEGAFELLTKTSLVDEEWKTCVESTFLELPLPHKKFLAVSAETGGVHRKQLVLMFLR